ncbi:MAG: serine hydrolase domain-containing protein [Pseudomonadota bacterium]
MLETATPESLGFDPDRLARFKPWMQGWVDSGRFPAAQVMVARHGKIAYTDHVGWRDIASDSPWQRDTILRIYSMTKPVTSVALLMLFEEAQCHLDTPVDEFLPEMADRQVLIPGATSIDQTRPAETRLTLHHLLTHTSGFTYSFNEDLLAAEMLEQKLDFSVKEGDLANTVQRLAELPLGFDPGARWNYGVSTDVIGRVVEVISGQSLRDFLKDRILGPLGMDDTDFEVPANKANRFASCYVKTDKDIRKLMDPAADSVYAEGRVKQWSGGGGLVSTVDDYMKFADLLRGQGESRGVRLLSPRIAELMATNALPGDLASMGQPVFSEVSFDGVGFGLGVSVTVNPGLAKTACNMGDFGWGGMASTMFWVDPVYDMVTIFMTQLVPSSSWPNRKELRALTYGALTDPGA